MKVSDYIIKYLENKGVDTAFCITGGASAHLLESTRTSNLKVIHNYNEQACAMGADGYARVAKKPAMVLVTNGPGSSNAITGVLGAWQDSIPMIVISGQVPRNQTMRAEPNRIRQLGLQEADIINMVQHCTNYAVQLHNPLQIKYELDYAWHQATTGRMGPVWLDIPIDMQALDIDVDSQEGYTATATFTLPIDPEIVDAIARAQRPLIIGGNGIHLANAEPDFLELVEHLSIPVVCTWNATDLFNYNYPLYVGNFGLLGERAANFAVQQADLLIVLGSRLSIPCIGYNSQDFAPNAIKIMVDIDANEISKHTVKINHTYVGDVGEFMRELLPMVSRLDRQDWVTHVQYLKSRFPVFDEKHIRQESFINSFDFIKELGKCLEPNDIVVTDMGTSFTCTMQALRNTGQNRLFTSSALCSMGFGLPGAIGAQVANGSKVICIAGDGGFQMNIQELQTVAQYQLPIKIILLNNAGYLAISLMQDNLFNGNHFGADSDSGVGNPDFPAVARAYKIPAHCLTTLDQVKDQLAELLADPGPALIEINMVRNQLLIPRVQSRRDSEGRIVSGSLDAMFPFLSDKELAETKFK